MTYRIIAFHRNQFIIKPDDSIIVNGNMGEVGQVLPAQTLLVHDSNQYEIGHPYLATDTPLTIVSIQPSPKTNLVTYRAKSRYRRHTGHRQTQTTLTFKASPPKTVKSKTKSKA